MDPVDLIAQVRADDAELRDTVLMASPDAYNRLVAAAPVLADALAAATARIEAATAVRTPLKPQDYDGERWSDGWYAGYDSGVMAVQTAIRYALEQRESPRPGTGEPVTTDEPRFDVWVLDGGAMDLTGEIQQQAPAGLVLAGRSRGAHRGGDMHLPPMALPRRPGGRADPRLAAAGAAVTDSQPDLAAEVCTCKPCDCGGTYAGFRICDGTHRKDDRVPHR